LLCTQQPLFKDFRCIVHQKYLIVFLLAAVMMPRNVFVVTILV
jgi:hypothetical protein